MTPLADVTASSSFVRLFALWCQCSEYQETSQYFGANVPRKSSSQGSPNSPFNLRQTFCCPFVGPSIHLADPIFAGEHHHLSSHVRRPIHRFCCWCLTFVRHQKKNFFVEFFPRLLYWWAHAPQTLLDIGQPFQPNVRHCFLCHSNSPIVILFRLDEHDRDPSNPYGRVRNADTITFSKSSNHS